jgi:hypothetical protein
MDGNVGGWFGEWRRRTGGCIVSYTSPGTVQVAGDSESDYLMLKTVNREGTLSAGKSGVVQQKVCNTSVWNHIERLPVFVTN